MNCRQFEKIIVNLTCDQLADAAERCEALAHAQSCALCGARLARQQTVAAGLSALATQEQALNAPVHIGASLMAAFERQQTSAAPPNVLSETIRFRLFPLLNWRWAAAMAAILIIAGLAASLRQRPIRQSLPIQNEIAAEVTLPVNQSTGDETRPAVKVAPKPKRNRIAQHNPDEYGELISLMPIAPTETEEFQQVVRMQIPRSTLRLWVARMAAMELRSRISPPRNSPFWRLQQ